MPPASSLKGDDVHKFRNALIAALAACERVVAEWPLADSLSRCDLYSKVGINDSLHAVFKQYIDDFTQRIKD